MRSQTDAREAGFLDFLWHVHSCPHKNIRGPHKNVNELTQSTTVNRRGEGDGDARLL